MKCITVFETDIDYDIIIKTQSEDEALARALQMSQEEHQNKP